MVDGRADWDSQVRDWIAENFEPEDRHTQIVSLRER